MSHGAPKRNKLMELGGRPLNSSINVTPFVDVCLVLLIIFMVVTPLLEKSIPVQLPVTENPEKAEEEGQLNIFVSNTGQAYMGDRALRPEDIESAMESEFEDNPGRLIAVQGDSRIEYGDVMAVLRGAQQAGFENVGLVTEPRDRSAATSRIREEEAGGS